MLAPSVGTVSGVAGRCDEPGVWYLFSSPLSPGTVYRYDPAVNASEPFERATPPIDTSAFETLALFATSKDGTRIPLFVSARKGLPRNRANPAMPGFVGKIR